MMSTPATEPLLETGQIARLPQEHETLGAEGYTHTPGRDGGPTRGHHMHRWAWCGPACTPRRDAYTMPPPAWPGCEPHITPPIPRGWSWCTPAPLWSACCDRQTWGGLTRWRGDPGEAARIYGSARLVPRAIPACSSHTNWYAHPPCAGSHHAPPAAIRACSLAPNSAAWTAPFGSAEAGGLKFFPKEVEGSGPVIAGRATQV